MKSTNLPRPGIIFLLLFAGIITACDSTAVTNDIEETMSSVPYLTAVEGAESVKATVNKDKERSNYSVSLEGMETKSGLKKGTYEAFCALWDTPIESDNSLYGDVKIHSIEEESYWKGINYMVNNLDRYYRDNEDLGWIEMQIAMWSIMEHKKFDLGSITESDLPGYVRNGDYSIELIDKVLKDVSENKDSFDPAAGGATAYYAEFSEAQDQIIIIPGGEIDGAFQFTFQNFANAGGTAIIQEVGGNSSSTSLTWNEDKPSPIEISISENSGGGVQLHSKIDTDGSNHNVNQGTSLPSSCSYGDLDRARVLIAAGDEDLKITLSGEFGGQTEELVVENGVTPGNQVEHVVGGLDFSGGLDLHLELDIEGDNRSSDGTSRVELEFGCPE